MVDENPEQGSLERLSIPVETQLGENVLTPASVKSVQFRVAEPKGYYFKDVEDFVNTMLLPSLEWYAKTLHDRDNAIYKLGEELDRSEVDRTNLRFQLQAAEYGSAVQKGVDANEEDKEMADLLSRLTDAQAQLSKVQQDLASAQQYSEEQDVYIDSILEELAKAQNGQGSNSASVTAAGLVGAVAGASAASLADDNQDVEEVEAEPVAEDVVYDEPVYVEPEVVEPVYEAPVESVDYAALQEADDQISYPVYEPVETSEVYVEEPAVQEYPVYEEEESEPEVAQPAEKVHPVYGVLPPGISPDDL
jgi:hypothetical protein